MNLGLLKPVHLERIEKFLFPVDVETVTTRWREASPWVEFDVWVHLRGEYRFALWRETGKIYQVDATGAADDDPIDVFPTDDPPRAD